MAGNLCIDRLMDGGIITNYACTSRCGHCLYGCSPNRERDYLDEDVLDAIVKTVRGLTCRSVHIGGGEPFLNAEALMRTISGIRARGVDVEYVETNAMWYRDQESAVDLLLKLRDAGLATLLISISPFHNGFIPFAKVKGVMQACRRAGMRIFPWIMDFYDDLDSFDDTRTHSLQEYCDAFGPHYLRNVLSRYWVHMGGRAVATYAGILGAYTAEQIIRNSGRPCTELAGTSHFHIDLYGNYLPGLCSGLAIRHDHLGRELDPEGYQFIDALYRNGVAGLLELAGAVYGYVPDGVFVNKCHLCLDIRRYLVLTVGLDSPELAPRSFYREVWDSPPT